MSAATYLPDWIALRTHATSLRRTIRRSRCTEASDGYRGDRPEEDSPAIARCTEAHPDAPGEWCAPCQARATARAELAAVKKQIASVERKMMREGAR